MASSLRRFSPVPPDHEPFRRLSSINPRGAVSTVLGMQRSGQLGRFSQPPDRQFLVDSAFDDTTRTGRFRQGNPNLGFEQATQFELSTRLRLRERSTLKLNVFMKSLDGLVATAPIGVNPDSSVFVNADIGNVTGMEVIFERERHNGWGARLAGVLQKAEATVTDAFELQRLIQIDPNNGDTLAAPARSQFPLDYDRRIAVIATLDGELLPSAGPKVLGIRPLGGLTASGVFRYGSGLPYSRTDITGDSLAVEPNGSRLPSQMTVDALFRRPLRLGRFDGGIYVDVRNALNTRNQVSVRRDTGNPFASEATIDRLANDAYNANPDPIPYESPRYRRTADLDNNGMVAGRADCSRLPGGVARLHPAVVRLRPPDHSLRRGDGGSDDRLSDRAPHSSAHRATALPVAAALAGARCRCGAKPTGTQLALSAREASLLLRHAPVQHRCSVYPRDSARR